jgi:hypothetical protein
MNESKIIKICKNHGPLQENNILRKYGRKYSSCRLCKKESDKRSYEKHKISRKIHQKIYNEQHKEQIGVYKKIWQQKNKQKIIKTNKERYESIKDCPEFIKKTKEYRDANKIKKSITDKEYRNRNKEILKIKKKEYIKKLKIENLDEYKRRSKNKWIKEMERRNKDYEGYLKKRREHDKKSHEKITDGYARQLLKSRSDLDLKIIPKELIDLKRIAVLIKREAKNVHKQR